MAKELEAISYVEKCTPILEKMAIKKEKITKDYCRKLAKKTINNNDKKMIEYVGDTLIGSYAV